MFNPRRWIRCTPLLSLLLLSACGFHLRGAVTLPGELLPLYIDKSSMSLPLYTEMVAVLRAGDTSLAENAETASSSLVVNSERRSKDIISVDSAGRAREYRLYYNVVFSLKSGSEMPVENSSIELARTLLFDPNTVLGTAYEEQNIYSDMIRDAAGQVMRRIQAVE